MTRPTPLWRNRDYLLLWGGQLISLTGTNVSQVAFPLLTLALTHSAAQAGLVAAARGAPLVALMLPAGALVDRWNRRRVMIVCDVGRALAMGALAVALALGRLSLPQLYATALVEGTLFAFFTLAETAALPIVTPPAQVGAAAAQYEATSNATYLVGPLMGGLLYGLAQALPFAADAVSYAISIVSVALIRARFQTDRGRGVTATDEATTAPTTDAIAGAESAASTSAADVTHLTSETPQMTLADLLRDVRVGVAWLWGRPLLRWLALLTGTLNATLISLELLVIVVARGRQFSPLFIGALLTIGGLGSVVGAALSAPARRWLRFGRLTIGVFWGLTLLLPLYPLARAAWALGLVFALTTTLGPLFNVAQFSYRLTRIPDELQGRVNSVYRLVALGLQPLGLALTGALLQRFGATPTIGVFVAILLALALATTANRHVGAA